MKPVTQKAKEMARAIVPPVDERAHEINAEVIQSAMDDIPPANVSRIEQAKRHALHNFDTWNDVTGFVQPHCGYYSEITGLIEDAVEFGFGVAHGQSFHTITSRIKKP